MRDYGSSEDYRYAASYTHDHRVSDTVRVVTVRARTTAKHMLYVGPTVKLWTRDWVGVRVRLGRLGPIQT